MEPIFEYAKNGRWWSVWPELLAEPEILEHSVVNRPNPQDGRTLLHYAVLQEDEEAIIELAAVWRASVNILDYNCKSPLQLAKEKKLDPHVIQLLEDASNRELAASY